MAVDENKLEPVAALAQPEVDPPAEIEAFIAEAAAAAADQPKREELSPVIIIPRTTFNYVFIAVVFLLVGIFIGWFSAFRMERANRSWVSEAISAAMAEQDFAGLIAQAQGPSLDNPDSRFEVTTTADHALGEEAAPIVMIEFGDFNCGYCQRFQTETLPRLLETYGDQMRFIYRDYPILAESSVTAAVAARCAGEQDAFWPYHDLLYANQAVINQTGGFAALAEQADLEVDSFNACVEEQRYLSGVVSDYQEGQSFGIRGTPAFFINGRPVVGAQAYEVFAGVIEEELAAASGESNTNEPNSASTG